MTVTTASSGIKNKCYGHISNNLLNGPSEWDISVPQHLSQQFMATHTQAHHDQKVMDSSITHNKSRWCPHNYGIDDKWEHNGGTQHPWLQHSEELRRGVRRQIRIEKHISRAAVEPLQELTLESTYKGHRQDYLTGLIHCRAKLGANHYSSTAAS